MLLAASPFWCLLALDGPIELMMSAMAKGGSPEQREWADQVAASRAGGSVAQHPATYESVPPEEEEAEAEVHIRQM